MSSVFVYWFTLPNFTYYEDISEDIGGKYNGYVLIHKDHPFFGLDLCDDKLDDIEVHGGISFSGSAALLKGKASEVPLEYLTEDYWCFGFDCLHLGDTEAKWPIENIEKECGKLAEQFLNKELIDKRKPVSLQDAKEEN